MDLNVTRAQLSGLNMSYSLEYDIAGLRELCGEACREVILRCGSKHTLA